MTQKVHSHKKRKDSLKTPVEPVFFLCNGKSGNYNDPVHASLYKIKKEQKLCNSLKSKNYLHSLYWLENAWWELLKLLTVTVFFLFVIHCMPGWTGTSHGVTKKEAQKDQSIQEIDQSKEPTHNRCLLILHLKSFRS